MMTSDIAGVLGGFFFLDIGFLQGCWRNGSIWSRRHAVRLSGDWGVAMVIEPTQKNWRVSLSRL
jgi:hypothetical protein